MKERSPYDRTTFIDHETGARLGSMDFALPSLRVGMSITMGGRREVRLLVHSWDYVFGPGPAQGLVVKVDVVSCTVPSLDDALEGELCA